MHSSPQSAFACLLFNKREEVQHIIVIPSDSHSGINYPPSAKRMCHPFFPERSFFLQTFLLSASAFLHFLQKFSASLSAVFSRHSLTQFSNLSLICSSPFYAASKKDFKTFLFLKSFFGFIMVWLTVRLPGQECSCLPLPLTFWPDPGMSCASFRSHSYPGRTGSENSFRNPECWFP